MKRVLMAMVAAVALSASPLAAGTPQFRAWDLCTPGSFRVCASVSISLDYVTGANGWFNGDYTRIVVTVANLQGQPGRQLDDIGGILWATFSDIQQSAAPEGREFENDFTGSMHLVGPGTPSSTGSEFYFTPGVNDITAGAVAGTHQPVWGCDGAFSSYADTWGPQPSTCGGTMVMAVNFEHRYQLSAATTPGLFVIGPSQEFPWDGEAHICGGLPGQTPCVPATSVPEPATMLLMATGLAGIGGAAIRRRRKVA